MSTIPMHPEGGIDPHLTFCRVCGGDADELALGVIKKAEVMPGEFVYASRGKTQIVEKALIESGVIFGYSDLSWSEVPEDEKVPAAEPCKVCAYTKQQSDIEQQLAIEKGGIAIRCKECGLQGVIKSGHPLAKHVREQSGIQAPDPVGIDNEGCSKVNGIRFEQCPMKKS